MAAFAPAHIAPIADAQLSAALAVGERLVQRATAPGLAFALDQLGDIDIPEPATDRIDKAQLRALASLYLAADLEPAGIIPSVETLAGLAATGAAAIDLGGAEPLLIAWWRHRTQRVSAAERGAFFSRLFGTSSGPVAADAERNFQFEERMLNLCEALYKLDELSVGDPYGGSMQQSRVRSAARALVGNLGQASGGITAFMAGEIIQMLKDAFAIVGNKDLRGAFYARDVWGVVAGIGRMARQPPVQAAPYIRRGKAGMTVVAWLADVSDQIGSSGALVTVGHPVVGAAADWIEATLSIGETVAATPAPVAAIPPPPPAQGSPWAALGR